MRTALVTGASSGIGRATVRRLDGAGWKVFAGVRKEEDAAELRAEGSGRLEPLMLDVLDPEAITAAAERVGTEPGGLDGLATTRAPRWRVRSRPCRSRTSAARWS